jgi:hypothetical protein
MNERQIEARTSGTHAPRGIGPWNSVENNILIRRIT